MTTLQNFERMSHTFLVTVARDVGIAGYRRMETEELRAAVKDRARRWQAKQNEKQEKAA